MPERCFGGMASFLAVAVVWFAERHLGRIYIRASRRDAVEHCLEILNTLQFNFVIF